MRSAIFFKVNLPNKKIIFQHWILIKCGNGGLLHFSVFTICVENPLFIFPFSE